MTRGRLSLEATEPSIITGYLFWKEGRILLCPSLLFSFGPFMSRGKFFFRKDWGGKFQVYDLAGHLVKEIGTLLPPPAKVTGRDLARWRQERKERIAGRNPDWWARFGRVIEKYRKSIYAYKPNIFSLTRTAQGNFLVSSNREATNSKAVYWLLNSKGKVLAKIETKLWILGISPHFIFFGGLDKEELPFIKAWKRQGTEAEDLLSFQRK